MFLASLALVAGLVLLVWSADRFVSGAAATARHLGMPPLLIGMVVIGFGTSAPEMVVSVLAAASNNPGIALGNAFGSNITNIALILGLTALLAPITVTRQALYKEIPLLFAISYLALWLMRDGSLSRADALLLLSVFALMLGWSIWQGYKAAKNPAGKDIEGELDVPSLPMSKAVQQLVIGLVLLVGASRLLVWGAVSIATALGVSDLLIGLTVVAVGTSLPELASSLMAAKKGEHDLALGNVLGSNAFNTLAVVGLAGLVRPLDVPEDIFSRDMPVMLGMTVALFVVSYGRRGQGTICRTEGALLLASYVAYTLWLIVSA